jgi:hypothetical protein
MRTAGGQFNQLSMYVWYVDNRNTFELIMKDSNDRWILKERSNGIVVGKARAVSTINPNTDYNVTLSYNGTNVTVSIDGLQLITYAPAGNVPFGTIGFTVKRTTGNFNFIRVD